MAREFFAKLTSFSISDKFRRISHGSMRSAGPRPTGDRRRRAAFGAIHFKREKTVKQLETAIEEGDTATIDEIAELVDVAELEEEHVSYVLKACEKGSLDVVATMLRHGAAINSHGDGNYAPLHVAVKQGNSAMAAVLISAGCNVDVHTRYERRTPLQVAAMEGHVGIMELLLKNKASVSAHDLYGGQALHVACRLGNETMVGLLLHHKANIDSYDNEGWTGLHFASEAGHTSMVKYLIGRYANVDCQSKYGRTSLHWACASGHVTVVNELLTGGANANIRDLHDKLALHYAKNETIRTLVKIHTHKPGINKQFVSTIGLYIQIDPRQRTKDTEFFNVEQARKKKWLSADCVANESQVDGQGQSFVSQLSDADLEAIEKRHRSRESKARMPIVIHDPEGNIQAYPRNDNHCADIIGNTFKRLVFSTNQEIENLAEAFRDFYSLMAIASDSTLKISRETIDNAILQLSSVQQVLANFEHNFQVQSDNFQSVMRQEKARNVSRGGSPPFIAIVAMFIESLLGILSTHQDPDIWKTFLETLKLPQEVQALLTIRLQFDQQSSLTDKLKHCVMFWARGCDMGIDSHTLFMKTLLHSVQTCEGKGMEDGVMVTDIIKDFLRKDTDFKTGSRHDKVANLSKLAQSLHIKETRMLLHNLEDTTADLNVFPNLCALERSDSRTSVTSQTMEDTVKRRRQQDEESLHRKLKDILEEEDTAQLVMVVKFLILCGREDLLALLL